MYVYLNFINLINTCIYMQLHTYMYMYLQWLDWEYITGVNGSSP